VLDPDLLGYWSDDAIYLGAMEAADIAFRADGSGWTYRSRDGGGFSVHRFGWHTRHGQVAIRLRRALSGTWTLRGSTVHHRVTGDDACDVRLTTSYTVAVGQDVFGNPATLLEFGRDVIPGTVGDRFARKSPQADAGEDPLTRRR